MRWQEDIKLPKHGNIRCFLPKRRVLELLTIFQQIDVIHEQDLAQPTKHSVKDGSIPLTLV